MTKAPANPPDGPRKRLLEMAQERGASLASLSEMLGRNPSYLQQFIRKGSPRKLEEEDRRMLARFFGVPEATLRETTEKSYAETSRGPIPQPDWVEVPRIDIGASAGPGAIPGEEGGFDTLRFSRRWLSEQGLEGGQIGRAHV